MRTPDSLDELIQALRCLPGVGPKSAHAHGLPPAAAGPRRRRTPGRRAGRIAAADPPLRALQHLHRGGDLRASALSTRRDASLLCVVETPADLLMMEQTQSYGGLYFVLMGRLSPLDGIGPREIHLDRLLKRATRRRGEGSDPRHQLHGGGRGDGPLRRRRCSRARALAVSRIARGLPVGGEIEHVDAGTLAQALIERRPA